MKKNGSRPAMGHTGLLIINLLRTIFNEYKAGFSFHFYEESHIKCTAMFSNHTFRFLILFCLILSLGCQKRPTTPLQVGVWGSEAEITITRKLINDFKEQNSGIDIELKVFPDRAACIQAFKMSEGIDVCKISSLDLLNLLDSDALRDLSIYKPDHEFYLPECTQAFFLGKQIYSLPIGWSASVLYYNRTLFEKHLVPLPQTYWDWNDFLKAAQILTLHDEETKETSQYGLEISPEFEIWAPFVWQNYGDFTNQNGQWSLIDPRFIQSNQEAVEFVANLVRDSKVAPVPTARYGELFVQGKAAMMIGQRDVACLLRDKAKFDWDVMPLPKGRQPASWVEVYGYSISSKSKQAELSWKLISALTKETSQSCFVLDGMFVPATKKLFESKLFLDFPGPKSIRNQTWLESLALTLPRLNSPIWPQVSQIMKEEMVILMNNPEKSGREMLQEAQARLEEVSLMSGPKASPIKR
jgi:multiple sugar transport system substrate-binding protein